MQDQEREKHIKKVIQSALGPVGTWRRPASLESVGLSFPEVYDRFEAAVAKLCRDIERQLSLCSNEELLNIRPESEAPSLNPLFDKEGWLGTLAIRLARLKHDIPQDFLGGWVHGGVAIEPTYWSAFQTYTLEQAILLSIGRDPRRSAGLDALFKTYGRSDEGDEMLYFLEDRLDQVASALGCDPSANQSKVDVAAFFELIKRANIKIDPKFRRMLRETRQKRPTDVPVKADQDQAVARDQELHGSSRKAYARIVTAICIKKYGLTADRKNLGKVAKDVENDTLLSGFSCSIKVIRGLLRDGLDQLGK